MRRVLPHQGFPRGERLRRDEFRKVFSKGRRLSGGVLTLWVFECGERKAGFVVRRSVRGAVKRNRLKRLLREIYRRNRYRIDERLALVAVAGEKAEGLSLKALERSFLLLLEKAGMLFTDH
jgi:ribonuclease P protein component